LKELGGYHYRRKTTFRKHLLDHWSEIGAIRTTL